MDLFGKLRTKILSLFFLNEDRDYYIREVASIVESSPRGAQNELVKLEKEGILKSEMRGKQRYFSVNLQNPSHDEMRSLILKKYGVPHLIGKQLADMAHIKKAFIYGSFAKGEEDYSSDIDCFIIADGKIDYELLNSRMSNLEEQFRREINMDIMTETEYRKRLAANDPYVSAVEDGDKTYLLGEGVDS
ncbi:MAG: nucleotidyltransferase domain-containing protein [Thermoleophilia bacterium]